MGNAVLERLAQLATQPGGWIFAGAVLAAIISSLTVILGAWINTRSARRIARDTFRRELHRENIKAFVAGLDEQIAVYQRLVDTGDQIPSQLRNAGKATPQEAKAKIQVIAEDITDLREQLLRTKKLWHGTAGLSVITRDQRVTDSAAEWMRSSNDFLDMFRGNPQGVFEPEKVKRMRTAAQDAAWKAVEFRIVLEEWMILPPGFVRRTVYRIGRRFGRER